MNNKNIFKTTILIIALWLFAILMRVAIRYWMDVPCESFTETMLWGSFNAVCIVPLYFFWKYINKTIKK